MNRCDGKDCDREPAAGAFCNTHAAEYEQQPRLVVRVFKPTARRYQHCTGCGCNYGLITRHVPGSEDCDRARDERDFSRAQ